MTPHLHVSVAKTLVVLIVLCFFIGMNVRGYTEVKTVLSGEHEIKSTITSYGWPFTFYETGISTIVDFEEIIPDDEHVLHETEVGFVLLAANFTVALLGGCVILFVFDLLRYRIKKREEGVASRT